MSRKKLHERLDVYAPSKRSQHKLIGTLTRDAKGVYEFTYSKEWLNTQDSIPVSWSLQPRPGTLRGESVAAFFDNLLPDSETIREQIARRFATAGKSTLDLLAAIGRDCVGALQFMPEGDQPGSPTTIRCEPLSPRKIGDLLRNLKTAPLGLDRETDFRISLAGAQEKTALLRWNGKWNRPMGATPTSHIFKPALGKLPNGIDLTESVSNEWLCLNFCEHLGLPVAKTEIAEFDSVQCLVVERFDRVWSTNGRTLARLHQEDLCQALGFPPSRKYQADGGPGMVRILEFLNASDTPRNARLQFIRAQIVFWLLGAIDGHAKNFSIHLTSAGFALTPIYDVMSALPALAKRQIEPKEAKLAMSVGTNRHYLLREIRRRHWEQTAKAASLPKTDLDAVIGDIESRMRTVDSLVPSLSKRVPNSVLEPILEGAIKQLRQLTK